MQLSKLESGQNNGHYSLLFLFLGLFKEVPPDKSNSSHHEREKAQLLTSPTRLSSRRSCHRHTAKRKTLASHLHMESYIWILSFLDFLLEKIWFSTQTDALLFSWEKLVHSCFQWAGGVNLLGGCALSVKTRWNLQRRRVCLLRHASLPATLL